MAQLGVSSRNAVMMEVEKFNAAGGLDGRPIEVIVRDSRGVPAEAARIAREMITSDRVDLLLDGEPSSGGFAVHEVRNASARDAAPTVKRRYFMAAPFRRVTGYR